MSDDEVADGAGSGTSVGAAIVDLTGDTSVGVTGSGPALRLGQSEEQGPRQQRQRYAQAVSETGTPVAAAGSAADVKRPGAGDTRFGQRSDQRLDLRTAAGGFSCSYRSLEAGRR